MDKRWGRRFSAAALSVTDREILRLAVPAFGALVAEPLFLLGDAAVVARLGTAPLAGVAVASTLLGTVVGLCVFLAYGTTAAVARRVGAEDRRGAVRDGVAGVWLALGLGIILLVTLAVTAGPLVRALGASPETDTYAATYLTVSALGLPFMLVVLAGTGVRRGLQDTRTPLVIAVVAAVVNLALSATLVLRLHWGVAGSAWATVVTQLGMAVVYVVLIKTNAREAGVPLRSGTSAVLRSAKDGFALFIRTVALRAVFLLTVGIAARLGDVQVAAYQVAYLTWILLALALDALAIAGQAIVGRSLGAGDIPGTRAAVRRMMQWGAWGGVVLGGAVLLARPLFAPIFSLEPDVATAVSAAMLVVALHQPIAGPVFVLDGVLIGAGDNRWLAGAQLVMLAAYVPAALAVPFLFEGTAGLVALWVAMLWFMLVRLVLLLHRERSDAWLVTGATR